MIARPVTDFNIDGGREYRLLNGSPSQVIQYTRRRARYSDNLQDLAIWVNDQWRMDRLTLGLGLRFAGLYGGTPEQHIKAGDFIPERVFPEIGGVVGLNDLLPRLGAAYDLFGNGRTAVKIALNKFLQGQGTNLTSAKNPQFTVVNTCHRSVDRPGWRLRSRLRSVVARHQRRMRRRLEPRLRPDGHAVVGVRRCPAPRLGESPPDQLGVLGRVPARGAVEHVGERGLFPPHVGQVHGQPTTC